MQRGYLKTSMREIADAVDVGVGNLYNYFENKDELFCVILRPVSDALERMLQEHHGAKGADIMLICSEEYLKSAVDEYISLINKHGELMKILLFHSQGSSLETFREDYTNRSTEMVKTWFADYFLHNSDITFDFTKGSNDMIIHEQHCEPWKVTVVDTGLNTMTGGRIKRIQKYVGDEPFLMTYGDGVCDVDMNKLVEFHKEHGKIATLTAVMLEQQKGVLDIGGDNAVKSFREKSHTDGAPINAGYMVLNPEIFDYIDGDDTVFEREPLEKLAKEGQLMSYMHKGFWQCMDTKREMDMLEKYLATGTAPWKKWD